MKNVKRILAVSMILAMVFIMASCGGSESKYAGTWKLDKVSASGMEITPAQMNMKFEFTVSGDGKGTLTMNKEKGDMKWKEIDKGIELQEGNKKYKTVEQKDGRLKMKVEGMDFFFKKKK